MKFLKLFYYAPVVTAATAPVLSVAPFATISIVVVPSAIPFTVPVSSTVAVAGAAEVNVSLELSTSDGCVPLLKIL